VIAEESSYNNAFANGTLTHTFLDVDDYHRYHFPVDGTIKEVRIIQSDDAVGGFLTWDPKTNKYVLDANTPGWQNIETRGCVIVETPKYGLVALLPIGMSQVSSINFKKSVKVGSTVKKGDMLGYFLFGGSDYVMLFQSKVDFKLTVPSFSKKNEYIEDILESNPYLGPKSEPIGYKKYLKSEEWKKKAKFARQLARLKCEYCDEKGQLEVHHSNYECLYNERFDDVYVLCRDCHLEETEAFREKAAYITYLEKKYGDDWPYYFKQAKDEFNEWLEEKERNKLYAYDEAYKDDY
jgi:hypothetical protein